jgi:hypothetical protein
MKKHWSDANMPLWVKTSITEDIHRLEREAALSWPRDAEPKPAFIIGGYGRYMGPDPRPVGEFYLQRGTTVERGLIAGWSISRSQTQARYYFTERDAWLAALWAACNRAADDLGQIYRRINSLNADAAAALDGGQQRKDG